MNIRERLSNYVLTLAGLVVTLVLSIISLGNRLQVDTLYVVIAIGLLFTLVIATIEHEIPKLLHAELDERLKVYTLLSQIDDRDYLEWAHEVIADCEEQLSQLAHGEYRTRMGDKRDRERLHRAKAQLRAVYLGKVYQELGLEHTWVASEKRYYGENMEALKRGVHISRIFILWRDKTLHEAQGTISDTALVDEMVKQRVAGIDVRIAWVETLKKLADSDVFKDFVIIDDFEVDERRFIHDEVYELAYLRHPERIRSFRKIYTTLENASTNLEEAFLNYEKAFEYVEATLKSAAIQTFSAHNRATRQE